MSQKKFKFLSFVLMFFIFSVSAKEVSNGVINFDLASSENKIVRLSGDWEFYKGQIFSTLSNAQIKIDFLQVPRSWTSNPTDTKIQSYGCNTYRVLISGLKPNTEYGIFSRRSPALSAKIFANSKFIEEYGVFSRHKTNYIPVQQPMLCYFYSNQIGTIELVIQVANFDQHNGGILSPIMFGLAKDIGKLYSRTVLILSTIIGFVVFIFMAVFLVWVFNKVQNQSFYFSVLLFFLLLRIILYDFNITSIIFKTISYPLQLKLQNLTLLSFGFFSIIYRFDNFFTIKHPYIDKAISFLALTLGILLLCLPTPLAVYIVSISIIIAGLYLFYSIFRFKSALKVCNYFVAIYASFYIITFCGIILDFFFVSPFYNMSLTYTEIGTIILVLSVVAYLALYLEFLIKSYINQKNNFSERYVTYRKFVPSELPHILKKESFGKIDLGDYSEIETTIMVIGEDVIQPEKIQVSLREQFETIGFYSSKIIEVIEYLGGTIISIAGNEITAFFTKDSKSAISAADEICTILQTMNSRRMQDYYPYVSFNISLHYGSVLLGIIGGKKRIDYTIISPNIELANNICTLAYYKKIPIVISESVASNLNESDMKNLKPLGRIKFRESPFPINLYGLSSMQNGDDNPDVLEVPRVITQHDADKYIDL